MSESEGGVRLWLVLFALVLALGAVATERYAPVSTGRGGQHVGE